jgi:RHS repeat-associated protein
MDIPNSRYGDLISTYLTNGSDEIVFKHIAGDSASNRYYYFHDGVGSVVDITNSTTVTRNSYDYFAFGEDYGTPTEGITNVYKYTGREWDSHSGMNYHRMRYNMLGAGRFTQTDALEHHPSYTYAASNPLRYVDPTGNYLDIYRTVEGGIVIIPSGGPNDKKYKEMFAIWWYFLPYPKKMKFIASLPLLSVPAGGTGTDTDPNFEEGPAFHLPPNRWASKTPKRSRIEFVFFKDRDLTPARFKNATDRFYSKIDLLNNAYQKDSGSGYDPTDAWDIIEVVFYRAESLGANEYVDFGAPTELGVMPGAWTDVNNTVQNK